MWIRGTAGPCREGAFAYANRPETAPIAPKPPPKTNLSMCTSSQQISAPGVFAWILIHRDIPIGEGLSGKVTKGTWQSACTGVA